MPYGDVVAALGNSDLVVLEASTGHELWSKPVGEVYAEPGTSTPNLARWFNYTFAQPWISGDTLYIATRFDLVGFNLMTGDEVFRTSHDVNDRPELEVTADQLPLNLVIEGNTAYVASSRIHNEYAISAIDLVTGETRWTISEDFILPVAQMPVSDGYLVLTTKTPDRDYIVALDTTDGSIAWTSEDAIESESPQGYDSISLFIANSTIIETRTASSANADPGGPKPEDALRIAAYDLESGDVLWTSRSDDPSWGIDPDVIGFCGFFPRISGDQVIVPCGAPGTVSTLVTFDIRGDGTPHQLPEWTTPNEITTSFIAGEDAWVFGTDEGILRLNLETGGVTGIGAMGGNVCTNRSLPTRNGFVCLTTDNLGTFTIQAFAPSPEATPASSPEPATGTGTFQPDYQVAGDIPVILRSKPGVRYDIITILSPAAPLQFLGESKPTQNPVEDDLAEGQRWMKVRTQYGEEGWIREINITEYTP